jgi:multidrug efflux pump subunit AcrA (membrane-fusion protein)
MKRLLKEFIALVLVIIVAAGLIFLFTLNKQVTYDSFTGNIHKVPINLSSPVYGQIQTLPVTEGTTVTKGQELATVQILNTNSSTLLSPSSNLYSVQGNVVRLRSPVNGIVGSVTLAPQSTVAASQTILQIYTLSNLQLQIILPQGNSISSYSAFFASLQPNNKMIPLKILGQVPTDVLGNVQATTTVYRATCQLVSDCQSIINNTMVPIEAQKKPGSSLLPSIPFLHSLRQMLTR